MRGTIDDFKTYESYQKLTGENYDEGSPSLLADNAGRQFFLCPISNPKGWTKEERLLIAEHHADFAKQWRLPVRVAVYTGVRHETYDRKKNIRRGVTGHLNQTYEDAEWIVAELKKRKVKAKNWAIDFNPAAAAGYTIHIPVNGLVGNQMFRMLLLNGGKILIATRFGLSHFYEDNSRTEKDFDFHIKWLVARINEKR